MTDIKWRDGETEDEFAARWLAANEKADRAYDAQAEDFMHLSRKFGTFSPSEAAEYYAAKGVQAWNRVVLNRETVREFGVEYAVYGYTTNGNNSGRPVAMWVERNHVPISTYADRWGNHYNTKQDREEGVKRILALQNGGAEVMIPKMLRWAAERPGTRHESRWLRAVAAMDPSQSDHEPMSLAEAKGYRDRGWKRWIAIVKILEKRERE